MVKPSDICDTSNWTRCRISSVEVKSLMKYWAKDCVIAYSMGAIGTLFILKKKRTYCAYYFLKSYVATTISHNLGCKRVDLSSAVKELSNKIIVNQDEFEKIKKVLTLKELKND
jgi:hypothetical protein